MIENCSHTYNYWNLIIGTIKKVPTILLTKSLVVLIYKTSKNVEVTECYQCKENINNLCVKI